MDESLRHVNPNPVLKANIFSKTFFWWLNPLFKRGYQNPLEESDLYNVCPTDASDYLGEKLRVQWEKQLRRRADGQEPSLLRALAATFGVQYMLLGFVVALEEGTKVVQPLLLGGLIRYFTPNSTTSRSEAWLYAMGVALCAIVLAISHHPYFFAVQRIGMRMRIACCSLMYKKCLRLSNRAMNESSVGQIVNLMSNDVNRFDQAVIFLHFLWVGPLQALAVLIILWHELGPSVLAGFVVLLLLIPVQGFMGKLFSKLRHKTAVHTDERVKVMNEIISGMRVIKMYCWEKPFGQLVEKIRACELVPVRSYNNVNMIRFLLNYLGDKLIACVFVMPFLMLQPPPLGSVARPHAPSVRVLPTAHVTPSDLSGRGSMNNVERKVHDRRTRSVRRQLPMPTCVTCSKPGSSETNKFVQGSPKFEFVSGVDTRAFLDFSTSHGRPAAQSLLLLPNITVESALSRSLRSAPQVSEKKLRPRRDNTALDRGLTAQLESGSLVSPPVGTAASTVNPAGQLIPDNPAKSNNTRRKRQPFSKNTSSSITRLIPSKTSMLVNGTETRNSVGFLSGSVRLEDKADLRGMDSPEAASVNVSVLAEVPVLPTSGLRTLTTPTARKTTSTRVPRREPEGDPWPSPSATVFTCILYAHTLHHVWFIYMMLASQNGCIALVTVSRVKRFLLLEELDTPSGSDGTKHNHNQNSELKKPAASDAAAAGVNGGGGGSDGVAREDSSSGVDVSDVDVDDGEKPYLQLKHVTAKWDGTYTEANTLEDVSLRVGPGELVAVIGPVGSGKSSLLMTILGELQAQSGKVKSRGTIAYVSQQPWVFSGSVRQNIIFGSQYDKARYDKVIKVAALTRDLTIMPNGDATLIGDRGVSLSGGQRARVSLARALYMDADIYLLDDPLSAVDSAVGRHIFEKCIVKYLKDKPRILVTHQVQFLPVAHSIYILKEGKINSQGSFTELSQSGVDFSELLKRSEEEEESEKQRNMGRQHSSSGSHPVERADNYLTASHTSLHSMVEDYEPEPVQLPDEEERAQGSVGLKVYVDYFKAGTGIFKFILLVLVNLLAQACYVGSDWWLSRWSNQEEEKYAALKEYEQFLRNHNITNMSNINANLTVPSVPTVDSHFNVYIFTAIIAAVFVFGLARALLFFKIAVDAARNLHNAMFSRVLRTNISFFDNNPVGRILNRFSKDVGHMDDLLPVTFFDFIQCALLILGIVLVAGVVNPWVFIPTVPLGILFVYVRKYYLETSRSIKRLEGTLRSPVFSYLSASLQGLHTIRAMRMQQRFMAEFDSYQDHHTEAWYLFLATSRWLAVRLDMLCALFVIAVTTCSMLAADTMNAGLVGLSITYTMTLMGLFQWGVRQSAEVENQMISVERVLEYSRLPTEAALESEPDKKPPPSWPTHGAIHAENVNLQYAPSGPYVLKNLSFDIKGKEKIGIVGRTGAGKSSLLTTLFRMVEPQGTLTIDGVNIQDIGLHDLRSKISIIPQDPVLFTGSLRKNLDPFQDHSDDQLWNALEEVKLKEAIKENTEGLLMEVSEGGSNFSVGQRQLVCLARAVLGHTHILVIDEATANVDPITDELIQQTIRTKFEECTVLTIAHRLHTIIDSDRVMVLDAGTIVEMDTPIALLSQQSGAFYGMVEQLGKAELENLTALARAAALRHGRQEPAMVNGKPAVVTSADGTLQDVTLSLETSSADLDNTYKIEDIEASLRDSETLPRGGGLHQEEEEEEESDSGEERKQLLTDSVPSPHADSSSDRRRPSGPAAVPDAEADYEDTADSNDESSSLLKSEGGTGESGEVIERRPLGKDTDSDSINV